MTKNEMIQFVRENPYVYVTHPDLENNEYIYADFDGLIWNKSGSPFVTATCELEDGWKIWEESYGRIN